MSEESMRILELRAENVKRITVVAITPKGRLVQITGKNGQGKTSVLDSIWMAFGGANAIPRQPFRAGQKNARIEVKVGNDAGTKYFVERRFTEKSTELVVTNAEGAIHKSPQHIMNELVGELTFDPMVFMRDKPAGQLETMRKLVPIKIDGKSIDIVDGEIAKHFATRTDVNRRAKSARMRADAIRVPDLPDEPPNTKEILERLSKVDEHNADVRRLKHERDFAQQHVVNRADYLQGLLLQREELQHKIEAATTSLEEGRTKLEQLQAIEIPALQDPAAIKSELETAATIVDGFRIRDRYIEADAEASGLDREAAELTEKIDGLNKAKADAISAAEMPVKGLGFGDGMVTFNGLPLSQASDAEQLRISTAIAAALNPKLRVLRIRDGSLLDEDSLKELETFAEKNDFQIWLERVDSSGAGEIVLEDGHVKGQHLEPTKEGEESSRPAETTVTDEQAQKAKEFVANAREILKNVKTRADADKQNATVKAKLARFPAMISTEWNPHYLARVKQLSK